MKPRTLMMAIGHTHREWCNYMRRIAMEVGIPESYHRIIMFLSRNPGANQTQLAEFCQKTTAAISQTVREMQLTGYLRKETDESDQRFFRLYLTEKGQECEDRIREKIFSADRMITSAITPEKEAELIELLEQLCNAIPKEF